MVDHLTAALVARDVRVELFNLAVTDIGKLAMAPVDAATIVSRIDPQLGRRLATDLPDAPHHTSPGAD